MVLSGIKFKVGYGISGGGFLLDKESDYQSGMHAVEHNLDLLKSLDIKPAVYAPELFVCREDEISADNFLKGVAVSDTDFITIIHAFSGNPSKNWMVTRFADLIKKLSRDYDSKIVLIGSERDSYGNYEIIALSGVAAINAAGKITLRTLLALIKRAGLFIGIDSGPAHLAGVLNRPVVVLYSGTNTLDEWAPKGEKVAVIQKDIICKGCEKFGCEKGECMALIFVEDALSAVRGLIGNGLNRG